MLDSGVIFSLKKANKNKPRKTLQSHFLGGVLFECYTGTDM